MNQKRLMVGEVFDWYDGVVLGVVRLSWKEGIFVASLLSWSQSKRRRAIGLVPVTQEQLEEVRALAAADWEGLLAHLRDYVGRLDGELVVVHVDETSDEVVAERSFPGVQVRDDLIGDVESALDSTRGRWLSWS